VASVTFEVIVSDTAAPGTAPVTVTYTDDTGEQQSAEQPVTIVGPFGWSWTVPTIPAGGSGTLLATLNVGATIAPGDFPTLALRPRARCPSA